MLRFNIHLIRLIIVLALGSTLLAVAVSRLVPAERPSRRPAAPPVVIAGTDQSGRDSELWLLDPQRERFVPLRMPPGERIWQASCAPWRDEQGRSEVVGSWVRSRRGLSGCLEELQSGLCRLRVPDGAVLDRIPMRVEMAAPPCWDSGPGQRILFTGWDDSLYCYTFETPGGSAPEEPPLQRLAWCTPAPVPSYFAMDGLCRLPGPRYRDHLIVVVDPPRRDGVRERSTQEIWWLQLDPRRTRIVAAGRMDRPHPEHPDAWRRYPTPITTPDGALHLAYLERPNASTPWRLLLVPLRSDPASGAAALTAGPAQVLAEGCYPSPPAVSADGHWITCLVAAGMHGVRPLRLETQRFVRGGCDADRG